MNKAQTIELSIDELEDILYALCVTLCEGDGKRGRELEDLRDKILQYKLSAIRRLYKTKIDEKEMVND